MRQLFIAAAALAVAGAAVAQTGDALMEVAFKNTVVVEIPGLFEAKTYYDADHTYRSVTPEGEAKGKWRVDGEKLCLTQTEPAVPENCANPLKPRKVGDSWTQVDEASGAELNIKIVAGR